MANGYMTHQVGDAMYMLSEKEAFQTMTLFLKQFHDRAGDDLATLMADVTIEADGGTLDPAAWDDWMNCVRAVRGDVREE